MLVYLGMIYVHAEKASSRSNLKTYKDLTEVQSDNLSGFPRVLHIKCGFPSPSKEFICSRDDMSASRLRDICPDYVPLSSKK
jgi:hypothetical protein